MQIIVKLFCVEGHLKKNGLVICIDLVIKKVIKKKKKEKEKKEKEKKERKGEKSFVTSAYCTTCICMIKLPDPLIFSTHKSSI